MKAKEEGEDMYTITSERTLETRESDLSG